MPEPPERPASAVVPVFDGLDAQGLFACSPLPSWVFDCTSLRFLAVNDAAIEMYGFSRDEFLGMTLRELRLADDVPALEARVRGLPHDERPLRSVWLHRTKAGALVHVEIASRAIVVEGREARLVVAADVTERIHAEAALRRSEASLAAAQQRAKIGSWEIDTGSGATVYSAQMYRLLAREQALGPPSFDEFLSLVHPHDIELVKAHYRMAAFEQQNLRTMFRLRWPDGRQRWMEAVNDELSRDASPGGPGRIVLSGTLQDIDERQVAQEALRQSEERWKFAVEGSGDAMWDHDALSGEEVASRHWPEMLGYAENELENSYRAWEERVHPDDKPAMFAGIQAHFDGITRSYRSEYRVQCKDGSWKWIAARGVVVARAADGRPLRMIGTRTDISELKRAEAHERELEAQLRQAQKMESIGTLAGGIAHDFNNILGAILGNLALVQQDIDAAHPLHSRLEQIRGSAVRARELVQQILAFSRKQPQAFTVQAVRPLAADALALMRSMLPAGVEVDAELADEPLWVACDATQLQQVLVNVATNAWHALQGRPGRIALRLGRAPRGSDSAEQARITVTDNGCGMDAATLRRAFEPFFTTKPIGQGTGLGLAVAHGIMASHGGAIALRSVPGAGSEVTLTLPLAAAPPRAPAAEPKQAASAPPRGDGQHVLYVDDDEVMVLLVERLLQRAGYRVSSHGDALAALASVRSDPLGVDLVVSDFNMPHLSGLDVAAELARVRADLPVMIVSGYVTDELRTDAARHGVRCLLHKEYIAETLLEAVHRTLVDGG